MQYIKFPRFLTKQYNSMYAFNVCVNVGKELGFDISLNTMNTILKNKKLNNKTIITINDIILKVPGYRKDYLNKSDDFCIMISILYSVCLCSYITTYKYKMKWFNVVVPYSVENDFNGLTKCLNNIVCNLINEYELSKNKEFINNFELYFMKYPQKTYMPILIFDIKIYNGVEFTKYSQYNENVIHEIFIKKYDKLFVNVLRSKGGIKSIFNYVIKYKNHFDERLFIDTINTEVIELLFSYKCKNKQESIDNILVKYCKLLVSSLLVKHISLNINNDIIKIKNELTYIINNLSVDTRNRFLTILQEFYDSTVCDSNVYFFLSEILIK